MTKSWKVWALVLLGMCICIPFWLNPNTMRYSTTSQFQVVDKGEEDNKLWIKGFNPQEEQKMEIRLFVVERNTWNLISENTTYFITYRYKEGQEPGVAEIEPLK